MAVAFITINGALVTLSLWFCKRAIDKLDALEDRVQEHGERLARMEQSLQWQRREWASNDITNMRPKGA